MARLWKYSGPETGARQQIRESSIGSKLIENRIDFQVHQPDVALVVRFLQPFERLIFVTKSRVDCCDGVWRDVAPALQLAQFAEHLLSLRFLARNRIGMAQERQHQRAAGKLDSLLKIRDCLRIHPFLLVSEPAIPARREEVGIEV